MKKSLSIFVRDAKRLLHNPVAIIVTIGVCALPSLYAWFNIYANWDPYASTSEIKVAIVNEDAGYTDDALGTIDVGGTVTDKLHDNDKIGWQFLDDEKTAVDGVHSGEYYAAIVIPSDFSANLTSALTGQLKAPNLTYYVNEKKNAIAPKVTDSGVSTIEELINSQFVSTVTEVVTDKAQGVAGQLKTDAENASTGAANDIQTVINDVNGAAEQLNGLSGTVDNARSTIASARGTLDDLEGQATYASNTLDKANGLLGETRSAASSLSATLSSALSKGTTTLSGIAAQTGDATGKISTGIGQVTGTIDGTLASANSALNACDTVIKSLTELADSMPAGPARETIEGLIDDLKAVSDKQHSLIEQITAESDKVAASADKISAASGEINTAVQNGLNTIDAAQSNLHTNSLPGLSTSLDTFGTASGTLQGVLGGVGPSISNARAVLDQMDAALGQANDVTASSVSSLGDVAAQLSSASYDIDMLRKSATVDELSKLLELEPERVGEFISSPVETDSEAMYPVSNYGTGVAPFYTNLALWVGGFVLIAIFKLEVDHEEVGDFKPWQGYFGRWLLLMILAVVQALICCIGDIVLVKIQCLSPVLFVVTGVVESFVYVNIIYAISVAFKHIGKALGVLLVILQIPGSSGMYPIEMMPHFFQAVHPWLPFTYGINAMRETIAGFYGDYYAYNIKMLLVFVIPALLVGVVLRRHLININSLFDRKLRDTDLMISENYISETPNFRYATVAKAMLHSSEYKDALLTRMRGFERNYPRIVRMELMLLPLASIGLMLLVFIIPAKLPMLVLWIVTVITICVVLIVVEYIHDGLRRRSELADMPHDEQLTILSSLLHQETLPFAPFESLVQRFNSKLRPDAPADADGTDAAADASPDVTADLTAPDDPSEGGDAS